MARVIAVVTQKGGVGKTTTATNLAAAIVGQYALRTLVLDLDETLVHSSFRPIPNPDFIIPVEIEGKIVDVYVLKRPHMDKFMAHVGQRFEVVVFTASLSKYAGGVPPAPGALPGCDAETSCA